MFTESATAIKPTIEIGSKCGIGVGLQEVWRYRELLFFLAWREIKVRYKQTLIGASWAIIQPVTTMIIFTIIFGNLAKIPSEGLPYFLFAFAGLLPWTYFAEAVTRSSSSVVGDGNLIKKVYFPRLIIPLAAVVTPAIDFFISLMLLVGMLVWFGITPTIGVFFLPCFMILALATALGLGLWFSALNVRYRDVRHTVPFLVQIWMYASPVVFPTSMVPESWRMLFALNPMAGVIEGFRWALLGTRMPDFQFMALSSLMVVLLFVGGLMFFRRMERSFADIV